MSGRSSLIAHCSLLIAGEERSDGVLTIDGVSKRFGGVAALTDVTVTVERGQLLAIIGPNGAGKSTLLRIVAGATRPSAGTVLGRPRVVGYVPQTDGTDLRL